MMVLNLVTASDAENVRYVVCARAPGGALEEVLEERGIPVFTPSRYFGGLAIRRSVQFLEQVIENGAIDLVHAHMADAAFLGWRLARRRALPLVITHHGHDILPKCGRVCRLVYLVLLAAAARYAARNVAVSTSVADRVRRRLVLRREQVSVIGNGVPVPGEDILTRRGRWEGVAPHVVTVGRLVEQKNQKQLIAAASVLVGHFPDARFSIVGDGPLRERLERLAKSLGLSNKINFTGSVSDVPAYLREADVYVSTSLYEGMAVATLEAMAWGVPVIASDVPGNRAVVRNGETGLLYKLDDIAGLGRAIIAVIEQPENARERARRARQLVQECYNATAATRLYEQLYTDVWRRQCECTPAI